MLKFVCTLLASIVLASTSSSSSGSSSNHGSLSGHEQRGGHHGNIHTVTFNKCISSSSCNEPARLVSVAAEHWCRYTPYDEFKHHMEHHGCPSSLVKEVITSVCQDICPAPSAPDLKDYCLTHTAHTVYHEWQEALDHRPNLQWSVFFVVVCLLVGAVMQRTFPTWIPYTVGILFLYMIWGIVAEVLLQRGECPWHAWSYATRRTVTQPDGHPQHDVPLVSRSEWNLFAAAGFNTTAFCVSGIPGDGKPRSCGDGAIDPTGCGWSFGALDAAFKISSMHGTSVKNELPQYLSADELWTPGCNLVRDMVALADIDPHHLLVIFLPALLFESACFGIDIGLFRKQIAQVRVLVCGCGRVGVWACGRCPPRLSLLRRWLAFPQICIMAFPAMFLASVITGALIFSMIPDWSFWVCWLIGIILSATDPVAVVALLKELGAAKSLGTLIEGESLLNDGSAVVLFSWVRNAIGYTSSTVPPPWMLSDGEGTRYLRWHGQVGSDLLVTLCQMLFFGLIFGIIFGQVTVGWARMSYNALYIEGPIVIAMSYLCFWVGELICGTSAVIAVVVMGIVVNYHKSDISADVFHFLHHFYGMAAHILNTVIFAIAGAKLGILIIDGNVLDVWIDYGLRIILIYPIILFARGVTIAIFFPVLKRLGTGCTWQEAIVMWWGGLRGSIGLALALIIQHTMYDANMWGDDCRITNGDAISVDCRDQPSTVVAMTVIVVAFTVILNAITKAPIMKFLNLTQLSEARKMMVNGSYSKLRDRTKHKMKQLRREGTYFKGVDWSAVSELSIDVFHPDIENEKIAAWLSVLSIERASYTEQFEHGEITPEAYEILETYMAQTEGAAQKAEESELADLYRHGFNQLLEKLFKPPERMKYHERTLAYHAAKAYIVAQLSVKHVMALYKADYAANNFVDPRAKNDPAEVERRKARKEAVDAMSAVEEEHKVWSRHPPSRITLTRSYKFVRAVRSI